MPTAASCATASTWRASSRRVTPRPRSWRWTSSTSASTASGAPRWQRRCPRLTPQNAQGELYLTDVIGLLHGDGTPVVAVDEPAPETAEGVNTLAELAEREAAPARAHPARAHAGRRAHRRSGQHIRGRRRAARAGLPPGAQRHAARRHRNRRRERDRPARDGRRQHDRRGLQGRARSPTCVPAARWPRARRSAASSSSRTPPSARARRCRT